MPKRLWNVAEIYIFWLVEAAVTQLPSWLTEKWLCVFACVCVAESSLVTRVVSCVCPGSISSADVIHVRIFGWNLFGWFKRRKKKRAARKCLETAHSPLTVRPVPASRRLPPSLSFHMMSAPQRPPLSLRQDDVSSSSLRGFSIKQMFFSAAAAAAASGKAARSGTRPLWDLLDSPLDKRGSKC